MPVMIEDMDAEELPELAEPAPQSEIPQPGTIAQQRAFQRQMELRAERALRWEAD